MNPNCVIALMLLVFLVVFIFTVDKVQINNFIDRFTDKQNKKIYNEQFQQQTTSSKKTFDAYLEANIDDGKCWFNTNRVTCGDNTNPIPFTFEVNEISDNSINVTISHDSNYITKTKDGIIQPTTSNADTWENQRVEGDIIDFKLSTIPPYSTIFNLHTNEDPDPVQIYSIPDPDTDDLEKHPNAKGYKLSIKESSKSTIQFKLVVKESGKSLSINDIKKILSPTTTATPTTTSKPPTTAANLLPRGDWNRTAINISKVTSNSDGTFTITADLDIYIELRSEDDTYPYHYYYRQTLNYNMGDEYSNINGFFVKKNENYNNNKKVPFPKGDWWKDTNGSRQYNDKGFPTLIEMVDPSKNLYKITTYLKKKDNAIISINYTINDELKIIDDKFVNLSMSPTTTSKPDPEPEPEPEPEPPLITTSSLVSNDVEITNKKVVNLEFFDNNRTFYEAGVTAIVPKYTTLSCSFFFKTKDVPIQKNDLRMIATANQWYLVLRGNILQLIIGNTLESSVKIVKNSIYQCTVTINRNEVKLFVNGNEVSMDYNMPQTGFYTSQIKFGKGNNKAISDFEGYFSVTKDDIVKTVLNKDTICSLYNYCHLTETRFIPRGNNIQECIAMAYNTKMCDQYTIAEDITKCQKDAQLDCYNCNNKELCKWLDDDDIIDVTNPNATIPSAPYIKCMGLDSKIKVDWIEPSNGGAVIQNYLLVVYETNNKNKGIRFLQMSNGNNKNCEYIITGLKSQTEYNVYVVAVNEEGMSDLSNEGYALTTGELSNEKVSDMLLTSDSDIHKQAYNELSNSEKIKCESVFSTVKDNHILNDINRQTFANSVKQAYSTRLDELKDELLTKLNPSW